jgi:hypothetical protein
MSAPTTTPSSPAKPRINFAPARKAIQHQHLELRIGDTLTERYSLLYLPPSDPMSTACWHYEKGGRGEPPRHIITFGENLAQNKREGCDLGDYARAYHRHECAHSLWTERNLAELNVECGKHKLPFDLLNLFEDARIEEKWRATYDEHFEWSHFEEVKPVDGKQELADRAAAAFSTMIQCEGDPALLDEALRDVPEAREIREQFYDRACAAKDVRELFPLMTEFVAKYGLPKNLEQNAGGARATQGDLKAGLGVATDQSKRAKLHSKEKAQEGGVERPGGQGEKMETLGYAKGGVLCNLPNGSIDPKRVQRIKNMLAPAFRAGAQRYKRETPTKRILVRDFVLERPRIYRATERTAPVHTKTVIVFDCSGSMSGAPVEAGRHLVLALADLAREGKIDGTLILSVVGSDSRTRFQKLDLRQVDVKIAERIGGYGHAEGLANAMERCRDDLVGASCTLVYTDGAICDDPIDRSLWHRRGVFSVGCYVGSADRCTKLRNWFDAPLCRSTVENLAQAMAETIRARAISNIRPNLAVTTAKKARLATMETAIEMAQPGAAAEAADEGDVQKQAVV